jgi:ACS family tartrate transporter-like MFS transporter
LLEGLPAVALGLVTLLVLPDGPAQARWLSHLERQSLESALIEERTVNERTHQIGTVVALTHRVVWRLGFLFLLAVTGFYGYSIWSPLVIQSLTGFSNLGVGLLSGLIALASMICMIASSAHSDRTGERPLHVAVPLLVMAAGFVGCALSRTPVLAIVSLALVPIGHMSAYGAFWSMPSRFLSGQAAAAGIALIATIVNVGGFLGPTAIGLLRDRTGTYTSAFWILGMLAGLSAMLAMQLRGAAVLQQDGQRFNTVTAA